VIRSASRSIPREPFTAYNDLAWAGGQLNSNITMITSANGGSGLPSSGQLIDFATGSGTGVTPTVAGGTFDGDGNVSGFATSSAGGVIVRRAPVTATYTLDSDCTGTLTFEAAQAHWDIVVTREKREDVHPSG
jgi:hypothetical protein